MHSYNIPSRRTFRDYDGMPPLLSNPSTRGNDVLVGSLLGLLGVGLAGFLVDKLTKAPVGSKPTLEGTSAAVAKKVAPLVGGLLAGSAAWYAQQSKPDRAAGHFVGALGTGVAVTASKVLAEPFANDKGEPMNPLAPYFKGIMQRPALPASQLAAILQRPQTTYNAANGPAQMAALNNLARSFGQMDRA